MCCSQRRSPGSPQRFPQTSLGCTATAPGMPATMVSRPVPETAVCRPVTSCQPACPGSWPWQGGCCIMWHPQAVGLSDASPRHRSCKLGCARQQGCAPHQLASLADPLSDVIILVLPKRQLFGCQAMLLKLTNVKCDLAMSGILHPTWEASRAPGRMCRSRGPLPRLWKLYSTCSLRLPATCSSAQHR